MNLVIEGIMAVFIIVIFFTALAPTVIGYINNNSTYIGLPQATILIFSLIVIVVVMGITLRIWRSLTEPEQPRMGYP
jgi:hypothetical protein